MLAAKLLGTSILGLAMLMVQSTDGCEGAFSSTPTASSGVKKTTTTVPTGMDGLTMEQRNVKDRLLMDNKPGSIKHLYIISPISGQVLLYSTVRGKVTSSGKRLTPRSVNGNDLSYTIPVDINGTRRYTTEVLEDDGTYGTSSEYLYWFDVRGIYHQIYPGSVFIQLSDQPLPVKSITINLEQTPVN